jgi:hypothetical protein
MGQKPYRFSKGWLPTIGRLTESLKRRTVKPLIGPVVRKVMLNRRTDVQLVSDFRVLCPRFEMRQARKAKAILTERGYALEKVEHVLLCWWKLKLLRDATRHHQDYINYIDKVYDELFLPEWQKQYKDFLDFEVCALEESKDGLLTPMSSRGTRSRVNRYNAKNETRRDSKSYWILYLKGRHIGLQWLVPTSALPWYESEKEESKTETLTSIPYDATNEPEFRTRVTLFLKRYAPKKLFLPSIHACLRVGMQRYNDGGETRRDSELPKNSWNSGFLLQEFMTGPLTPREVWLPGRTIKANNSFWFSITDQICRACPWFAYNYSTVEELYNSIKVHLEGNLSFFDVSGYGLQYPRPLLRIIVEEIRSLYYDAPRLVEQADYLLNLLESVEVQLPSGRFIHPPERGIGLGYYEALKTIGVLAILMHLKPISIYGDQGFLPSQPEKSITSLSNFKRYDGGSYGPRRELETFGFYFKDSEKAPEVTFAQYGIPWSGTIMSKEKLTLKKSLLPQLFGALSGEFHWERKNALRSIIFPREMEYMWNYIAFQYELVFGWEFTPGDSMGHPDNAGVNPLATRVVGFDLLRYVDSLEPPKHSFESQMSLSIYPTRNPIPASEAKKFSIKRKKTYLTTKNIPNSYSLEAINPRIRLNNNIRPELSNEAKSTPFWQAARLLLMDGVHTGTITCGLTNEKARRALSSHSLAPNPFEAKATGGYSIETLHYHPSGPPEELVELMDCIEAAHEDQGVYTFRRDMQSVPPVDSISSGVPEDVIGRIVRQPVRYNTNPYVNRIAYEYLVNQERREHEPVDLDLSDLKATITSQFEMIAAQADSPPVWGETEAWDYVPDEAPEHEQDDENIVKPDSDPEEENLWDALEEGDEETSYRPSSPGPLNEESEHSWIH